MKIAWTRILEGVGIAYGYSNHQAQLKQALINNGVTIDPDADVQISITPAGNFERVPDKINVLYTMYEATDIPPRWIPLLNQADLIVVPCEHNKKLFRKYTNLPIEVCLEGVKTDVFTYTERSFPKNKPFRFLWFGASNERKGYKHMVIAWALLARQYPEIYKKCELYMKTTQNSECPRIVGYKDGEPIYELMPKERIFRAENAIVDTRKLPEDELAKTYHDAHAFVFPTMGEGFGLTLAEAMATGLPCIYTPWSGPIDFISDKEGYPLKYSMRHVLSMMATSRGYEKEFETTAASPNVRHIVRRMVNVYSDYENALKKGKLASDRIRKEITWDISAKRFMEIINKYYGDRV